MGLLVVVACFSYLSVPCGWVRRDADELYSQYKLKARGMRQMQLADAASTNRQQLQQQWPDAQRVQ